MLSEFTAEEKFKIIKYVEKPPKTEAQLKRYITSKAFNLLLNKELIYQLPSKGKAKSRFAFTDEAKKLFAEVKVKKPVKPRKKAKPKSIAIDRVFLEPIVKEIIHPYFETLENRIKTLEQHVITTTTVSTSVETIYDQEKFVSRLKYYYEKINSEERRGGMVPIPKLWDKLQIEGFSRNNFVSGLFELERQRIIELQTASDPKVVRGAEKAIKHSSRGLINYVIWRR